MLYLALEDSKRRLKDRLEKLCPEGAVPSRLAFVTEWRRAGSGGVEDIAEWCDSVANPLLVVVDTLERIRPSTKPGSWQYSNDYAAISALQTLAHDRRLAIVIVHHVRKMSAAEIEGAVIKQVRGVLRSPEMIVRTWRAGKKLIAGLPESEVREALQRLDPLWDELFPAEQARIVQLLVERVDVGLDAVDIRLRTEGLANLTAELGTVRPERRAA